MKSLTKYTPLVRMTYMSMAKTTPRRKPNGVFLWSFLDLAGWAVLLVFVWVAVG